MLKKMASVLISVCFVLTGSIAMAQTLMKVEFTTDVETGKVSDVKVYKVQGDKKDPVQPKPLDNVTVNGKKAVHIPDFTIIRTHSSPGCVIYCIGGYCFEICS